MAGTEQPKPISMGTILLPDSPILRNSLSMTKAILAIYPVSSKMDRKKNNVTMVGRKLSTLPTPPQIPSITRERTTGLISATTNSLSSNATTASTPMVIKSESSAPIKLNVIVNINAIIPIKHGIAVYLPVKIRSIAILRLCSLLSRGRTTVFSHRDSINENRISANAASRSSPVSFSITDTRCSNAVCFSRVRHSFSAIRWSCSTSFVAAKRRGSPFSFASNSRVCIAA